jgi:hypothetical protein
MAVYRVWNNHQVNYVKNDISIMRFVFKLLQSLLSDVSRKYCRVNATPH